MGIAKNTFLPLLFRTLQMATASTSSHLNACPVDGAVTPVTEKFPCSVYRREKCQFLEDANIIFSGAEPASCSSTDQMITLTLRLGMQLAEVSRYDLTLWIPTEESDTESPWDLDCAITVFPCEDFGDHDGCGDLPSVHEDSSGTPGWTSDAFTVEVPCRRSVYGQLALPFCLTWAVDTSTTCGEPYDALDENCHCRTIIIPDVVVHTEDAGDCSSSSSHSCYRSCVETSLGSGVYTCFDVGSGIGDPHLVGFRGQKFDFAGQDGGHYTLLAQSDPPAVLTMLLHAPIPALKQITYIVGFGLKATDLDGNFHTVQIRVKHPKDVHVNRQCPHKDESCLGYGVLTLVLDGRVVTHPGTFPLGPGFEVGAVNLPEQCRALSFEKHWTRKVLEANAAAASGGAGRRLDTNAFAMDEWILRDRLVTNRPECESHVARAVKEGTLFDYLSEYVSFQISTPDLAVRINHGKLQHTATRDPTNSFDLPDYRTFHEYIAIERVTLGAFPQGVLGETGWPTMDGDGRRSLFGSDAVLGDEEDYRVSGPFSEDCDTCLGAKRKVGSHRRF